MTKKTEKNRISEKIYLRLYEGMYVKTPCGCKIWGDPVLDSDKFGAIIPSKIEFCPLHENAQDLRNALQKLLEEISYQNLEDVVIDGTITRNARAVVEKSQNLEWK